MPTEHIIALLITERDKLSRAIEALQGPTRRLGRPPKNPAVVVAAPTATSEPTSAAPAPAKRRKRTFTAAQRKAFGERMKKYWAAKRKAEARTTGKSKAVAAKKKAKAA
jgi:hypothetical protein